MTAVRLALAPLAVVLVLVWLRHLRKVRTWLPVTDELDDGLGEW